MSQITPLGFVLRDVSPLLFIHIIIVKLHVGRRPKADRRPAPVARDPSCRPKRMHIHYSRVIGAARSGCGASRGRNCRVKAKVNADELSVCQSVTIGYTFAAQLLKTCPAACEKMRC